MYKCTACEFASWVGRAAPHHLETDAGRRTKRDLVDALAHACATAARARASSGTSGGAPLRARTRCSVPSSAEPMRTTRTAD